MHVEMDLDNETRIRTASAGRREAAAIFAAQGLPTRTWEEYKYCDLSKHLNWTAEPISEVAHTADLNLIVDRWLSNWGLTGARVILLADGKPISLPHDLPEGLSIKWIQEGAEPALMGMLAAPNSDPMIARNAAEWSNGVQLRLGKGKEIEVPIVLLHVHQSSQPLRADFRFLFELESSSSLTLVEAYAGAAGCGRSQLNVVGETVVAEGARFKHLRIQDDGSESQQVNTSITSQHANSQTWQFTFTSGGALVRNNTQVQFEGQHGEAHLLGLYLGHDRQLIDNHTLVDHRVPNCNSNELYKGALQGKSTAVFNGKIYVRRDAQKTNAFQSNRNILLSTGSTVNTKPQLEIYADDVKCSHGTSTGQLDPSALFYLRSRGLGVESARKLLLQAFLDEVVQQVTLPSFQEAVRERVYAWLQQP